MLYITGNRYLTQAEMETNAKYIWGYLSFRGWTMNAVAGMLGNMQSESTINPGIWEGLAENVGPGYGLVQWTPASNYTDWCASQGIPPDSMDSALERIIYELDNGLQYYPTDKYPETFAEFKLSVKSPEYLARAFLHNYERPADPNQPNRQTQARAWFSFLGGASVGPVIKQPKGLPLLLLYTATRRRV